MPSTGSLLQQIAGVAVNTTSGIHHPYIDLKYSYFAPRFGFAWQPFGVAHWSVRGGAGIFFDRGGNSNWSDSEASNPPGVAGIGTSVHNSGPQPPTNFSLCTSNTFPYGCPIPAGILATINTPNGRGGFGTFDDIGGVDPHLKRAYLENFFLGVQHSFRSNWIAEADLIHANAIHEYITTNLNRQDGEDSITYAGNGYGSFNAPNLNQALFPNTFFNNINYYTNQAGSSYNGLTGVIRKAFSKGYAFQVAYTYQKTIDLASSVPGAQKGAETSLVVDAYNLRAQRATSSQNVPQQVSTNGLWEIKTPFIPEGLLKNIVGGWQLSGISTWLQGFPGSIYTDRRQDDFNLDGNLYDFPNKAVAGTKLKRFSQQQFLNGIFNQNATYSQSGPSWPFTNFPLPVDQNGISTGVEGNGGRNSLRGPGFVQVDGGLTKNTTLPWFFGEKGKLQLRADFYNVFNHKNLQGLDLDLGHGAIAQDGTISGTFGKTLGQGQARTIQMEAQFRF